MNPSIFGYVLLAISIFLSIFDCSTITDTIILITGAAICFSLGKIYEQFNKNRCEL